jgi:hypothetical protein
LQHGISAPAHAPEVDVAFPDYLLAVNKADFPVKQTNTGLRVIQKVYRLMYNAIFPATPIWAMKRRQKR